MSFSRTSKLLVQVCHDCLSKSIMTRPRFLTTQTIKPTPTNVLGSFRSQLYQQPSPIAAPSRYNPLVRKAISRRENRKRLLKAYKQLSSSHIAQLTSEDMDSFLDALITNPDDLNHRETLQAAFKFLKDVKSLQPLRQQDAERMIYLATELDWTEEAVRLLKQAELQHGKLSMATYEAVMTCLSTQKQYSKLQHLLQHMQDRDISQSKAIVRAVVMSYVQQHQLTLAASYLRQHHPTPDLAKLVTKYGRSEDRELLDNALSVFTFDCLHSWRLNEARLIYICKRTLGMSTTSIIQQIMNKSLQTRQILQAQQLWIDALELEDTASALQCSKRLIRWYTSQQNIKHAVQVWQRMEEKKINLGKDTTEYLLVEACKLKYHVDSLRIYRRCQELLYPLSDEAQVHLLRCLVRADDYKNALLVPIEPRLAHMPINMARIAVQSLFRLASKTGNLELFERVFRTSEKLKLSLTHRGLTTLVACYLTRGDIDNAKNALQSVADHTEGPDVVDFNLLMRCVVLEDGAVNYDKIFDILSHMSLVNVQPDQTTLRTLLGFYNSESEMQKSLYDKLLTNPTAVSRFNKVYLNNIALSNLLTKMPVDQVYKLLKKNDRGALFPSKSKTPIDVSGQTFKILLDAANRDQSNLPIAEMIFDDMHSRGLKPKIEYYHTLIQYSAQTGKISKARSYIQLMEDMTGEKPPSRVWLYLVDYLISTNKLKQAQQIVMQDMKHFKLDSEIKLRLKHIDKLLIK